ncbi:MAG: hypothetical protein PHN37_02725 [Candidatus Pacebacteria bacterium]|nr:hypothetical protein [Candidatus Paceibacterota bacterium]
MDQYNVKKYFLYKTITDDRAKLYSLFKLGHVSSVDRISKDMAVFISKTLFLPNNENVFIYTTHKIPIDNACKKSSLLLSENISKFFKLPIVIGEYYHVFNDVEFYNNKKTFRKTDIKIPFFEENKILKKKKINIIVIDDSFVTGDSLQESLRKLFQITKNITFFSIIKLKGEKKLELDLNEYIFKNNSYNILPKIVMESGYRFTTQMLRVINDLPLLELGRFINKIDSYQRKELKRGFKNFFGRSLQIN